MIVVDASLLVDLLLGAADAGILIERLRGVEEPLHAPEVVDLEFLQTARRHERNGKVPASRAEGALRDLAAFPLRRHSHRRYLDRIWELRGNLTAYDAAYVALAEGLGATLLTRDAKLAASPGHGARIELV
jgi:predicted nucleic acid-binding protein